MCRAIAVLQASLGLRTAILLHISSGRLTTAFHYRSARGYWRSSCPRVGGSRRGVAANLRITQSRSRLVAVSRKSRFRETIPPVNKATGWSPPAPTSRRLHRPLRRFRTAEILRRSGGPPNRPARAPGGCGYAGADVGIRRLSGSGCPSTIARSWGDDPNATAPSAWIAAPTTNTPAMEYRSTSQPRESSPSP
jgi:hypothetical protein